MPDVQWWYILDGKRHGPISAGEVRNHLGTGNLSACTPVWRMGMENWARIDEVQYLKEIAEAYPPPLEIEAAGNHVEHKGQDAIIVSPMALLYPAGPWHRYIARQIDFMIYGSLAWFIIGILFHNIAISKILDNQVVGTVLTIPLALLIEIPIMRLTGGSTGKWIFGIYVRRLDGSKLRCKDLFYRNLQLWVEGLGLAIPPVSLCFLFKNYKICKEGKRSSWDAGAMHNVRQITIGDLRSFLGFTVFATLLAGLAALSALDQQFVTSKTTQATEAQVNIWANPRTGLTARVYAGWRNVHNDTQNVENFFQFENVSSVIIFAREELSNYDMERYIYDLQKNNRFGNLSDKKIELDAQERSKYILTFKDLDRDIPIRIDVKVWQTDHNVFWRSVILSPLHDERGRAEARAFADELEATTVFDAGGDEFGDNANRS